MAMDSPSVVSVDAGADQSSYVDWPAIIGGIVLASAVSLILISFGAAIGLNFLDFQYNADANPILIGIAAAVWFLFVVLASYMSGSYITGRLRRRHFDASEEESDLRDGVHGLLVWAGAAIVGAYLAMSGVGTGLNALGSVASTATEAASTVAGDAVSEMGPNAYYVDSLFRSPQATDTESARAEATRIFAQAALNEGTLPEEDRAYLVSSVAANTGLAPQEAEARVEQVSASVENARQQAVDAARTARNTAIISAFLISASLLAAAIASFWAAQKGGNHRDKKMMLTEFRRF